MKKIAEVEADKGTVIRSGSAELGYFWHVGVIAGKDFQWAAIIWTGSHGGHGHASLNNMPSADECRKAIIGFHRERGNI